MSFSLIRQWCFLLLLLCAPVAAQDAPFDLLKKTFEYDGVERHYFLSLPTDFDPEKTYWPLVVVHGGGGHAEKNGHARGMRRFADELGLPAILILPEFNTDDKPVSRFPVLGEGNFLKEVLRQVRANYSLHEKILLNGYSMGGQLSHRFALGNPEMIQACAPFSPGSWSTPDGKILMQGYGEIENPKEFFSDPANKVHTPDQLHDLFEPRTASVAGLPAAPGAEKIPFLVMCGTLDPRWESAKEFAERIRDLGYTVETEWPRTPHGGIGSAEYGSEFEKYPRHAVQFFLKHTQE